jgi:hypothetical protein
VWKEKGWVLFRALSTWERRPPVPLYAGSPFASGRLYLTAKEGFGLTKQKRRHRRDDGVAYWVVIKSHLAMDTLVAPKPLYYKIFNVFRV